MASEISVLVAISATKSTAFSAPVGRTGVGDFTMIGDNYVEGTVTAGTSATLIPLGGVTSPGWAYFKNLDADNYVTIRNGSTGADLVKILPGEPAQFRLLDTSVPYAVANTASVKMEYLILQK